MNLNLRHPTTFRSNRKRIHTRWTNESNTSLIFNIDSFSEYCIFISSRNNVCVKTKSPSLICRHIPSTKIKQTWRKDTNIPEFLYKFQIHRKKHAWVFSYVCFIKRVQYLVLKLSVNNKYNSISYHRKEQKISKYNSEMKRRARVVSSVSVKVAQFIQRLEHTKPTK